MRYVTRPLCPKTPHMLTLRFKLVGWLPLAGLYRGPSGTLSLANYLLTYCWKSLVPSCSMVGEGGQAVRREVCMRCEGRSDAG